METCAHRIKLKAGSLERVRQWAEELSRRQTEALATLRDETVILECFFLEQAEDGDYLIGVMCAENFEQSRAAVEQSLHSIDAYHQQFKKDTWESGKRLELLVELNLLGEFR
ncbi:hypothetical protein EHF33_12820 [Deinococcus psychrotolerans]|uniref:Uncharacterized protein n=1 Tax=Deinococcus psychrotolerans TaxID=2489213 RepID=A0A3G8YDP9_9DEIO|nr:DUF6176 family protein [Deinococcus psychrotolerans]AZI43519.1 hypothetical protein EHF33_12820 [Deinococcus psychrotolerans]